MKQRVRTNAETLSQSTYYLLCESPLLAYLLLIQARNNCFRIDNGDDPVKDELGIDLVVDEEGLGHWGRVGEAGRFDDDGVEVLDFMVEPLQALHEVPANRTAETAIHYLDKLLVDLLRKDLVVYPDVAELVLYDGKAQAVIGIFEDMIEKGGFP